MCERWGCPTGCEAGRCPTLYDRVRVCAEAASPDVGASATRPARVHQALAQLHGSAAAPPHNQSLRRSVGPAEQDDYSRGCRRPVGAPADPGHGCTQTFWRHPNTAEDVAGRVEKPDRAISPGAPDCTQRLRGVVVVVAGPLSPTPRWQ